MIPPLTPSAMMPVFPRLACGFARNWRTGLRFRGRVPAASLVAGRIPCPDEQYHGENQQGPSDQDDVANQHATGLAQRLGRRKLFQRIQLPQ
jgi:hypothetical protein